LLYYVKKNPATLHWSQVNQKLLLEDLYESRQCNRLLETETAEEAWPASGDDRLSGRQNSQFDAADAYEVTRVDSKKLFLCFRKVAALKYIFVLLQAGYEHKSYSYFYV
jgi:hypothetical protein